jgi:hypothetical protein
VFDTALKDCIDDARIRARSYYLKCMYLANSLSPRTFYGEEWFVNCSQALQRYQREAVQRDEAAYNSEREPYLQVRRRVLWLAGCRFGWVAAGCKEGVLGGSVLVWLPRRR